MTFEEQIVIKRNRDVMASYAYKLTSDTELSKDLIAETHLKMLENKNKFTGGDIIPWAFTIMRNTFFDSLKKGSKLQDDGTRVNRQVEFDETKYEDPLNLEEKIISEKEQEKNKNEVHFCIGKLAAIDQQIIILREEFKYQNIANKLGLTEGSIKQRVRRILESLKKCLEQFR